MAAASAAPVIYFSLHAEQHVVLAHLAAGERCVFVRDGWIVFAHGERQDEVVELERVAFTYGGTIQFQVQNALAAAAAAWGAGLNPAIIARALTTFATDPQLVPGRFNVLEYHGIQVIMDYGHNQAALAALAQAAGALGQRYTVLALGLPGDRRDDDLRATIAQTSAFADEYILYDLRDRRGRRPGEVPELLRAVLPPDRPCSLAVDQADALRRAWSRVPPGGRLVLIIDEVDEALELVDDLKEQDTLHACEMPARLPYVDRGTV
ncbi:MAG TPA: cyanophycin synthetase, partial [Roseiflexaceae bacterium]|nr:cyanophycin synthetase [Roseiflexaceae bacterium]